MLKTQSAALMPSCIPPEGMPSGESPTPPVLLTSLNRRSTSLSSALFSATRLSLLAAASSKTFPAPPGADSVQLTKTSPRLCFMCPLPWLLQRSSLVALAACVTQGQCAGTRRLTH